MNPFKRYMIDLGDGEPFMQDESEVAGRFKSIISSVFPTLGNQQLNVFMNQFFQVFENMVMKWTWLNLKHELSVMILIMLFLLNNLREFFR